MKKLLLIVAAAMLAVACNSTKTYVVEGQIEGLEGTVAVMNIAGEEVLAETTAENGAFSLSVESAEPLFAALAIGAEPVLPLFLDGSPIKVSGNMEDVATVAAAGTASNDAFAEFNKSQMELMGVLNNPEATEEDIMGVFAQMQEMMDASYEASKDNLWGAYLFVSSKYRELSAEEILATVEAYPAELQKVEEIVLVKDYAEKMLKTEVGKPYTNITLPNTEGEEVSLKDVVAANKVVLLDFWASWCRPCMGEMPYLLEAYATYHDKGFEIYGVSLDDNAEAWKATIEKQGMQWVNVSELKGWQTDAAKEYSVNSIPANYLINAEGVIIAKNLRGEALAEKLAELFE